MQEAGVGLDVAELGAAEAEVDLDVGRAPASNQLYRLQLSVAAVVELVDRLSATPEQGACKTKEGLISLQTLLLWALSYITVRLSSPI